MSLSFYRLADVNKWLRVWRAIPLIGCTVTYVHFVLETGMYSRPLSSFYRCYSWTRIFVIQNRGTLLPSQTYCSYTMYNNIDEMTLSFCQTIEFSNYARWINESNVHQCSPIVLIPYNFISNLRPWLETLSFFVLVHY